MFISANIFAQQMPTSSYFMDRMPMRNKLNPALMNDYGYLVLPGLGGVNLGLNSNVGLSDFLHPSADGASLNTFLHPSVSTEDFEKSINDYNNLDINFNLPLLSFGWFSKSGSFYSADLSCRSDVLLTVPGDLFRFVKYINPIEGTEYDLSKLGIGADAFVELALGYARPINEKLTVGAKVKFLLGVGSAQAQLDKFSLNATPNQWSLSSAGSAHLAFKGLAVEDENGKLSFGFAGTPGIAGSGVGIDIGATYKLLDDKLTLSAALIDLGFISWSSNATYNLKTSDGTVKFDGLDLDASSGNLNGDIDDQLKEFSDKALALLTDFDIEAEKGKTKMLNTTLNVGVEYDVLDYLSVGVLSSTYFGGPLVITECMGAVNFTPAKWINLGINGTLSNAGHSFGAIINFCPRTVNIYASIDHFSSLNVTPQFIPIDGGVCASLGIMFSIGRKNPSVEK